MPSKTTSYWVTYATFTICKTIDSFDGGMGIASTTHLYPVSISSGVRAIVMLEKVFQQQSASYFYAKRSNIDFIFFFFIYFSHIVDHVFGENCNRRPFAYGQS
mmetsp:Transcript_25934/g.36977  ORF Transcript_25934/g.36977 Transcript_25934/m.36977 type:complete len:103 (+) Transcript_25934:384-692(+)